MPHFVIPNANRVIILGHSGFIGSHLERLLSRAGIREVIGRSLPNIDLGNSSSAARLAPYLTQDSALVLLAGVKRQFGDTLEAFWQNMAIVENICRLLEDQPIRRLIFLSSAAVYGEETENTCISEQTPINPTSYYGIAKYSSELLPESVTSNPPDPSSSRISSISQIFA